MDAVELQAVRSTIIHGARDGVVHTMQLLATLAGIMVGAYGVDCLLRGELIRTYGDTSVITLAIGLVAFAVLPPFLHLLRLRALRDLDKAPVFRTSGPIDLRGGLHMRLRPDLSTDGEGRGYELHLIHGFHAQIDPEFTWRVDFARTQHGPDRFYILDAQPIRAASGVERSELNQFLWSTGVYTEPDGGD
jgi:hypothetical protein